MIPLTHSQFMPSLDVLLSWLIGLVLLGAIARASFFSGLAQKFGNRGITVASTVYSSAIIVGIISVFAWLTMLGTLWANHSSVFSEQSTHMGTWYTSYIVKSQEQDWMKTQGYIPVKDDLHGDNAYTTKDGKFHNCDVSYRNGIVQKNGLYYAKPSMKCEDSRYQ